MLEVIVLKCFSHGLYISMIKIRGTHIGRKMRRKQMITGYGG
jgi:hypothetical protein